MQTFLAFFGTLSYTVHQGLEKPVQPPSKIKLDPAHTDKLYKPSHKACLSNMARSSRFPQPKQLKDKLGPGFYQPENARQTALSSNKTVRSYTFEKTARRSLAKAGGAPGPGEYSPLINSKGLKTIGMNRSAASLGMEGILKGSKRYRSRGFGTMPRWDNRREARIAIPDKYMKKLQKSMDKIEEADAAERMKKENHGTFGVSPQFCLFKVTSTVPGPGHYNPEKPPTKRSGNVKLGHKMTVKGGRGVEGEAIGDDDSFQVSNICRIHAIYVYIYMP